MASTWSGWPRRRPEMAWWCRWHEQGEDVAQRNVVGSLDAVGAILAPAGVSYADLVLVVKPSLVELGPGGVEDPAAEPAHGVQASVVGLAVGPLKAASR